MSLRALLYFASNYFRRFRRIPGAFWRFPKNVKLSRAIIQHQTKVYNSRFSKIFRSFGNPNSLVRNIQKAIFASSTHSRPNSLLRAYSGLAGSVQLRHQLAFSTEFSLSAINEVSKQRDGSWFGGFLSSLNRYPTLPNFINTSASLIPKELIGTGCNSAVWSAEVASTEATGEASLNDRRNNELAVKVLYNYYASTDPDQHALDVDRRTSFAPLDVTTSLDWVLLHRQLERECELRPSTDHPNIVPLVGHFLDRAPASTVPVNSTTDVATEHNHNSCQSTQSDSCIVISPSSTTGSYDPDAVSKEPIRGPQSNWVGADSFPEGFGGQPLTYYLLMPKFSATLEDLFNGTWDPVTDNRSDPDLVLQPKIPTTSPRNMSQDTALNSASKCESFVVGTGNLSSERCSTQMSSGEGLQTGMLASPEPFAALQVAQPRCALDVDDIVAILAQLFDAVAELERLGIAHRDIKPNNILLRPRPSLTAEQRASVRSAQAKQSSNGSSRSWLDDNEILSTNTRFHVAITDFGCATRMTRKAPTDLRPSFLKLIDHVFDSVTPSSQPDVFTHSGNTMLLAPEITTVLRQCELDSGYSTGRLPLDYSRADLWAVATLIYPLFGRSNPFTDGTVSSATYTECELPDLPDRSPGIISWILTNCLRRDPSTRPSADLVADVLHTWCLLRHSYRRRQRNRSAQSTTGSNLTVSELGDTIETDLIDLHLSDDLECKSRQELPARINQLRTFLNVCWAADWLTGPARPPDGLRVSFYRRLTLNRLSMCIRIVSREETLRASRVTNSIATTMGAVTFPTHLVDLSL